MRLSDELAYVTAGDLARRIRRRELSPVEVVDAFIQRIEERNPSLNALVMFDFDRARADAAEAERVLMSGADVGPLHGVPTATKDFLGSRTGSGLTFGGLEAFADFKATEDGMWADRMQKAGAIIVGQTNAPVFAFRGTTDNPLFGPTSNPFDPSRNTGGSSGGSAAAVADGMLPIAQGNDGGGSIRIPSSWCGLFGYKASAGRIPFATQPNAFMCGSVFASEGTMVRTVEDAIIGLNILNGYDPGDPIALPEKIDFTPALQGSVKGWRIAYSPDFDVFPVDPEVAVVVEQALDAFRQAGATVEEVSPGFAFDQVETGERIGDTWSQILGAFNAGLLDGLRQQGIDYFDERRDEMPEEILYWVERALKLSPLDMYRDQSARTTVYNGIQGLLNEYNLIVTPTMACPPVKNSNDRNTLGPDTINGVPVNRLIGYCMTFFMNYTGHPAATVPAGLDANGLPVGLQIIGNRYADMDVLAASAVFERVRPWYDLYSIPRDRTLG